MKPRTPKSVRKARQKKYKPKPVKANAVFNVIQGVQQIEDGDKLKMYKDALIAKNKMQFGGAKPNDFTILCDMLNVTTLLAARGIGEEYMQVLVDAREAMQDAKQRYLKSKKLGFNGFELQAVNDALEVHSAQLDVITYRELTLAFDIQDEKIRKGIFYHRDGDLKPERVAA